MHLVLSSLDIVKKGFLSSVPTPLIITFLNDRVRSILQLLSYLQDTMVQLLLAPLMPTVGQSQVTSHVTSCAIYTL